MEIRKYLDWMMRKYDILKVAECSLLDGNQQL